VVHHPVHHHDVRRAKFIGGGLVGALIGFIFARTRAVRQRRTQIWLLIAVAVGLLALLGVPLLVYR